MRKRTWLVDSLWKEADIAEVSAEVVSLADKTRGTELTDCVKKWTKHRETEMVRKCGNVREQLPDGIGDSNAECFSHLTTVPITAREWDEYMKDTFSAQLASHLDHNPAKDVF